MPHFDNNEIEYKRLQLNRLRGGGGGGGGSSEKEEIRYDYDDIFYDDCCDLFSISHLLLFLIRKICLLPHFDFIMKVHFIVACNLFIRNAATSVVFSTSTW